jgi:hypothetical protein
MADVSKQSDIVGAEQFSLPQFGFITKEVTERLRVSSAATSYLEELAEIENVLGKSLYKVSYIYVSII